MKRQTENFRSRKTRKRALRIKQSSFTGTHKQREASGSAGLLGILRQALMPKNRGDR